MNPEREEATPVTFGAKRKVTHLIAWSTFVSNIVSCTIKLRFWDELIMVMFGKVSIP